LPTAVSLRITDGEKEQLRVIWHKDTTATCVLPRKAFNELTRALAYAKINIDSFDVVNLAGQINAPENFEAAYSYAGRHSSDGLTGSPLMATLVTLLAFLVKKEVKEEQEQASTPKVADPPKAEQAAPTEVATPAQEIDQPVIELPTRVAGGPTLYPSPPFTPPTKPADVSAAAFAPPASQQTRKIVAQAPKPSGSDDYFDPNDHLPHYQGPSTYRGFPEVEPRSSRPGVNIWERPLLVSRDGE